MTSSLFSSLIAANASLRASVRHDVSTDGTTAVAGLASGFKAIDRYLPWQGWPTGAMTEIMTDVVGRGEFSLLLPAMARVAQAKRHIVCIGAPFTLYSPALEQMGIDPSRVSQVYTAIATHGAMAKRSVDALWSAEQVLKSGTAGMVLLWTRDCTPEALHRLHLSLLGKDTVMVHFRRTASVMQRSPAWLRMTLTGDSKRLRLQVLKCRGHLMARPMIDIDRAQVQPRLFAQLEADRYLDTVTRFGITRQWIVNGRVVTSWLRAPGDGSARRQPQSVEAVATAGHAEPDAT